jgi:asparagine synthase (glutamine-hydrolysing)
MCGICGIVDIEDSVDARHITLMRERLAHRGPDDFGVYAARGVGLGHQRLSIIDLTDAGHQPMVNEDSTLYLVFNGEIYNYVELRDVLRQHGHVFRSESDSEVILHAYEQYGPDCVSQFNGMFAFAIWDTRQRSLFLARDRIGIKPLYYAAGPSRLAFASEVKALLAAPGVEREANCNAIRQYWDVGVPVNDETWFKGILQLMPGHWALWKEGRLRIQQYWDFQQNPVHGKSEAAWAEEVRALLTDAVRLTLRSDVPVGAHLSGGLDSSALTALASLASPTPVRTFSGRYAEGPPFDEGRYIRQMVDRYHTDAHEVTITPECISDSLRTITWHMDYPIAGSGVAPQFAVCQLTKARNTKVVLGGQGGDELFAGYFDNYQPYLETLLGRIWQPSAMRDFASTVAWLTLAVGPSRLVNVLQHRWRHGQNGSLLSDEFLRTTQLSPPMLPPKGTGPMQQKLYWDIKYRLPALLHVEDRTSMAASLESRVPLLDYRLVELAGAIPDGLKLKRGQTKYILRRALDGLLPAPILARRDKIGFTLPLERWFTGPLNHFAREVIQSKAARERGIFAEGAAQKVLENGAGTNWASEIWLMLSIEMWYRTYIDSPSETVAPAMHTANEQSPVND